MDDRNYYNIHIAPFIPENYRDLFYEYVSNERARVLQQHDQELIADLQKIAFEPTSHKGTKILLLKEVIEFIKSRQSPRQSGEEVK